ncbi:hypothetical protein GCM10009807_08070 [Microbacterium lacus]|uniref:Acyltransferase 3 domain-containing protein n=2 Tax=Microbacterium lacus TaxID=415217 RepID=A0ABN2G743_9MICO
MEAQAPSTWMNAADAWSAADQFLTPIRIPFFFFISGFLVARAIQGSLRQNRKPWLVPAYLYVIWSTLLTLRLLLPAASSEHTFASNLLGNLLLAGSGYWYLYALPLYFLYTHLTRSWKGWIASVPLVALLVAREPLTEWTTSIGYSTMDSASLLGSVFANGIFFWLGARYGKQIVHVFAGRGALWVLGTVAVYSIVQLTAMLAKITVIVLPLASILGIAVGIMLTSGLSGDHGVIRGIRYIGQRTLPVYVLQFFFISVLSLAWGRLGQLPAIADAAAASWVYPIVITAAAASVSLLFYAIAMRTRALSWLFVPPAALTRKRTETRN